MAKGVAMSDQLENLKTEDISIGDRPLNIRPSCRSCRFETLSFSEFVHGPSRWHARARFA